MGPPGERGLPVLKPAPAGSSASPQTMGEALNALGLTDSKAGREIIQAMQAGGLPLTKETAAKLNLVMDAKPANVPVQEWLEAAVIAEKRGLPVTPESVRGLQQAVFGPQLHQLLSALEDQLNLWMEQQKGGGEDWRRSMALVLALLLKRLGVSPEMLPIRQRELPERRKP